MYGLMGNKCPNWKGGFDTLRPYLSSEVKCIKLNKRFNNSEFHHIMKSVGVFIPKYIHRSIWHDLKNNKNMNEINVLSLNYLINNL